MIKNRIARLQNVLKTGEAFIITSPSNRFYLTGVNTSAGTVLITPDDAVFFIDFRYYENAKRTVNSCRVVLNSKGLDDVVCACNDAKIKTVYLETSHISISEYNRYCKNFEGMSVSNENILDCKLGLMRAVKSEEELRLIKQSQFLTDQTFEYITERIEAGRTERDIMLDMEFFIRRLGSDGVSFDFIVVSGKNSSLPHGVPTEKVVEKGDFVTMDFGAVVGGYRSDMTRTVAVGSVSDEQKRVYDTVLKAQIEAFSAIKGGVVCSDIDKIARDIIYDAGYKGCFGHSLGHSVGLDVHESPNFSPVCHEKLPVGAVITVEPGIYIENKFGVRIEDMVFVTENGAENLTKSTKKLMIL